MEPVVTTIESRCKRCYVCIQKCPAKAIKVEHGQAKVIPERCIACGYCVRVCSQHAKKIRDGIERTLEFLENEKNTVALLAPSFPAACSKLTPGQLIAGLKELGFSKVYQVAFGADLVGAEYKNLTDSDVMPIVLSSPCPAIVSFIQKYYPALTLCLAPIVSPMVAMGRVAKKHYNKNTKVVFIGPCIAKKHEIKDPQVADAVDEVLTFEEVGEIFERKQINLLNLPEETLDGPEGDLGRIFSVSGGLLKVAALERDILENDIVVTEGRDRVVEIIHKVYTGDIEARFLDILFCEGCINGPKMANDLSVFVRKDLVTNFMKNKNGKDHSKKSKKDLKKYGDINLHRSFKSEQLDEKIPSSNEITEILEKTGKFTLEDELNCGSCGYLTCREQARAVLLGHAEAEMCLPYTVEKLSKVQEDLTESNKELKNSLSTLKKTQRQLVQSEKLASVGQLAAGVAHELNNPLAGILLYSNLLLEQAKNDPQEQDDLKKVVSETERCKNIVKGLLDFSRQTQLKVAIADINNLLEGTINIVEQQPIFRNIQIETNLNNKLPKVSVDVGQMQQVFLNIILNASDAMQGTGSLDIHSGIDDQNNYIVVTIKDTGPGIPQDIQSKIFDPFFTTKPQGKGTGLGLAIAYGTIQKHNGIISVESEQGTGTTFTIKLPTVDKAQKGPIEISNNHIISR